MARPLFVDTHVHFWDLTQSLLRYNWLDPDRPHPVLGDTAPIRVPKYTADEYIAETRFQSVTKCVHVQAAIGSADPVDETRWLQVQANRTGFPQGIVAYCDLASPRALATLERHAEFENVRGIRDFGQRDYLLSRRWHKGYSRLAEFGLVYCLDIVPEDLPKARMLADRFPEVILCIDHAGFPRARDNDYFKMWKRGLIVAAGAPNVVCKISGLGMCDHSWTTDSLRPWVLTCIEAFGSSRCFFGTNWPVDRLYSSYGDVLNAYSTIMKDLANADREAMFSSNAERIFRI